MKYQGFNFHIQHTVFIGRSQLVVFNLCRERKYLWTCICVCIHVCECMCACLGCVEYNLGVCMCTCVCMCVCAGYVEYGLGMYVCTCVFMSARVYICVFVCVRM